MKTAAVLTAALLAATCAARADFSYTTTRKMTGGSMSGLAGAAGNSASKMYLKGQKMKVETGDTAMIFDFEAQTITAVDNARKSFSVQPFSAGNAVASEMNTKIDVKETGQKKVVNGYNASELVMTMDVSSPATARMGTMQMEMDMWISPDVPGLGEMREFYRKNASRFPWASMGAAGNPGMQRAMADLQRRMAEMNGVPVLQVMRMKAPGMGAMPQMSADQMEQMKQAIARMQAQGGQQAAAAQAMMARMGAMNGGAASPYMMEMTMESSDFSTSSIPDSVFVVPLGYQKVDK